MINGVNTVYYAQIGCIFRCGGDSNQQIWHGIFLHPKSDARVTNE